VENQIDLSAFTENEDSVNNTAIEDLVKWAVLEGRTLELLKKEHAERKDALDKVKEQIAQTFKSRGLKSMKLNSGLQPLRATSTKFYVKGEADQEAVCQWFEDNNLGYNVKRSVNFQTMNAVLNERIEAGEPIPKDLVDWSERDTLRMGNKTKFLAEYNIDLKTTKISVQNGKVSIK